MVILYIPKMNRKLVTSTNINNLNKIRFLEGLITKLVGDWDFFFLVLRLEYRLFWLGSC